MYRSNAGPYREPAGPPPTPMLERVCRAAGRTFDAADQQFPPAMIPIAVLGILGFVGACLIGIAISPFWLIYKFVKEILND